MSCPAAADPRRRDPLEPAGVRRGQHARPIERGARTDDHLAAAKALWSRRPADFDGQFTTLRTASLGVPPVTPGGPPVWVGGNSDAALRRTLHFGDGWYRTGVSAAEVIDVRLRLRELADATGDAERLTLAAAAFLTPPGIPAAVSSPGRPLGGPAPTAASVVDDLGRFAEAGLIACPMWLPIAAEHVEEGDGVDRSRGQCHSSPDEEQVPAVPPGRS